MDDNFEENLAVLLKATYELYEKKYSKIILEIWFNSLQRFEFNEIEKAFSLYIQNPDKGTFIPKPANIIGILEGSHQSNSYIAWTKVKKAFGQVGQYESVVFDDSIIHKVIQDMGGWIKFCQTQERELPFIKKEFADRYQAFKVSGGVIEYPKQLEGLHNAENSQKGLIDYISEPVLIGDNSKARLVLNGGKQTKLKELI